MPTSSPQRRADARPTNHTLSDLLASALEIGVTVHISHLVDCLGLYDSRTREIHIDFGLTPIEQRCITAHELGHALYGHDCSTPRAEREADIYAADVLIDASELENLDQLGLHDHDIAIELDVTTDVLTTYREHHMQRLGTIVYPRRGRGKFSNALARALHEARL